MITPALLGAIVGLILALTGAGGGILAVPLLMFAMGQSITEAAPAALIAVGASAAIGALLGLREGLVRYRAATLIGLVGMLLAPLGVGLARWLPNGPLMIGFALVLAWVAVRMFRQTLAPASAAVKAKGEFRPCKLSPMNGRLIWTWPCAWTLAAIGAVSGVLSGLLGVGGGFVIVPTLNRFTDLPPRSVLATSLAVIALVSVGSVGAAALQGDVRWGLALPFAGGAIAAQFIGRRIAARVAGARLQQAFALTSAIVSLLMLARALHGIAA